MEWVYYICIKDFSCFVYKAVKYGIWLVRKHYIIFYCYGSNRDHMFLLNKFTGLTITFQSKLCRKCTLLYKNPNHINKDTPAGYLKRSGQHMHDHACYTNQHHVFLYRAETINCSNQSLLISKKNMDKVRQITQ